MLTWHLVRGDFSLPRLLIIRTSTATEAFPIAFAVLTFCISFPLIFCLSFYSGYFHNFMVTAFIYIAYALFTALELFLKEGLYTSFK